MKNESCVIFTICNIFYLPKALVLGKSVFEHTGQKLEIFIFDKKCEGIDLPASLCKFTWVEDLNIKDLYKLAFKYDVTEFSTSLKAYLALYLLNYARKVIYLDPDIYVYSSLKQIKADLDLHPIVLTPHYTTPQPESWESSDLGMLRFGSFNLGFFAVADTHEARSFLTWWHNRCISMCFFETQFGLSTDQKWVSIAPCFFPNLHISFNLGYNVAFWNLHERKMSREENGIWIVNNYYPLIFFHFSSFDYKNPERLTTRPFPLRESERNDFFYLAKSYGEELEFWKGKYSDIKYAFDYMSDGSYISPALRRAYASVLPELPEIHDPFDSNGVIGKFVKKNKLLSKTSKPYKASGFKDIDNNKNKFVLLNKFLRLILFVIGPNSFSDLSRLFIYISSYRINRDLWRL